MTVYKIVKARDMAGVEGLLRRLRSPGRLNNPDISDLSLVRRAANKEKVIMAKKEDGNGNTYNWDDIPDDMKSALALSHEAIKDHIDSLPEEVGDFLKSAAKELDFVTIIEKAEHEKPPEGETEDEKKERMKKAKEEEDMKKTEMIKAAFPGVLETVERAVVTPLQVQIQKAEETIADMQGKLQRDDMRTLADELTLGEDAAPDERVDELIVIRKSLEPKAWNSYVERERGVLVQLEKSQLFERQANPQAAVTGSAYAQLEQIAKSIVEKSEDKDPSKAMEFAIETNPALYEQHRKEQAAQAKAGVTA